MDFSPQQLNAMDGVGDWLRDRHKPFFYLAGYAGTGKTTLAKYLACQETGLVLFAAYTGKAATVMRKAGCPNATTIHSLIYVPKDKSRQTLNRLKNELLVMPLDDPRRDEWAAKVSEESKKLKQPAFVLNEESEVRDARLVVVDECSMIDRKIAEDLLSFGTPILVLGDPAQLPPVMGEGFFTSQKPDFCLTEIHRQARDNPIIRLATDVREGRSLQEGEYGQSRVVSRPRFDRQTVEPDAQVIVGKNATRRNANAARRERLGFSGEIPLAGERVVCLRNNHSLGVLNGEVWNVDSSELRGDCCDLQLNNGDRGVQLSACLEPFRGEEVDRFCKGNLEEFDFGYALTCHKSQGSQWPSVFVVDESWVFGGNSRRWLYTAVTRASERVTVIR